MECKRNTLGLLHAFLRQTVKFGDVCVDATAGKGRDTLLLCECSGRTGKVYSFDIQASAIAQTKALLDAHGKMAQCILDSHSRLSNYLEEETVDVIVFNLGRLPGGDVSVFTTAETTIPALEQSLRLLRHGGVIAMAVYYGGHNGYAERDAVLSFLRTLDDKAYTVLTGEWSNRKNDPPIPVLIWKE